MTRQEERQLRRELLPNGAVWGQNAYSGSPAEGRCTRCRHLEHSTTACAACGCKVKWSNKGGPRS